MTRNNVNEDFQFFLFYIMRRSRCGDRFLLAVDAKMHIFEQKFHVFKRQTMRVDESY